MTCQQTTAETLKKVCEETVFRMDVLESKTTQHVNNISEGCQMTVDLHPVAPSVDSAHAPVPVKAVNSTPGHVNHTPGHVNRTPGHVNNTPGHHVNNTPATVPVETVNSTSNDERWSTVVRKGVKRRATPEVDIQQCNPVSPLTRMKKPVIGRPKVAGIVAAERRKKKANIFASRFAPDQSADELKTYLDGKLNTNVNIAELDSKHPDCYKSFYISVEIDDPKAFLNEHLWPEGIYVRLYRPAEKMLNKDARNAEPGNGSSTSVNL